jgi:serine/threonine-protein kinase RsbT
LEVQKQETMLLRSTIDVSAARQKVRSWAMELRFSIVDQTKIVTAASELARNTLIHGKGGTMVLEALVENRKKGLRLIFEDEGPGISNLEEALQDGFTTGSGLGLGLGGSKRLVNDFEIYSKVGDGTRITVTKWC